MVDGCGVEKLMVEKLMVDGCGFVHVFWGVFFNCS